MLFNRGVNKYNFLNNNIKKNNCTRIGILLSRDKATKRMQKIKILSDVEVVEEASWKPNSQTVPIYQIKER